MTTTILNYIRRLYVSAHNYNVNILSERYGNQMKILFLSYGGDKIALCRDIFGK